MTDASDMEVKTWVHMRRRQIVLASPRTEWYPWRTRPYRVGWYEMRGLSVDSGMPMFWNGAQWGYWVPHPYEMGKDYWVHWADDEKDEWRGLARPA